MSAGTKKQFGILKDLMNRSDVDIIVNACEAHLHIPMADFVVYVVVAAPLKPDQVGQAVFRSLFEVALFQTLPALFLQPQPVPQVVQKLLKYICRCEVSFSFGRFYAPLLETGSRDYLYGPTTEQRSHILLRSDRCPVFVR